MLRVYRMWRFLRIVERRFLAVTKNGFKELAMQPKDPMSVVDPDALNEGACMAEFMTLSRKYDVDDALTAYMMARKGGYIESNPKAESAIRVDGSLFGVTSRFGLLKEWAHSVAPLSSLAAVLIAAAALAVSIWRK